MYQLTNYGGSGLQVVTPEPPDAGGAAINANFKALATQIATSDPGADDDSTAGFGVGSRWYNSTTTVEWICLSAAPGDAEWAAVASGTLAAYLPLTGGTLSGPLDMNGNALNLNTGGGTGGGTLNLDGATVYGSAPSSGVAGGTWNLGDGSGSNGGAVNMEGGRFYFLNGTNVGWGMFGDGTNAYIFCEDSSGQITFYEIYPGHVGLSMNGGTLNMNGGGGADGGTLNMDGGFINFNPDATTPTNTTTPAGWVKIQINGSAAWLPYYQ